MLKNTKSVFLMFVIVFLSLTACNNHSLTTNTTNETSQRSETTFDTHLLSQHVEAQIYVNGELLQNGAKALISDDFVKIPFVSVFEALGASVSWESDTNATISYNDKTYFLDTEALTLSNSTKPNMTYLFGLSGGSYIIYAQDKEIILDSRTLGDLFERLRIDVTIECNRENDSVSVFKERQET